MIAYSDTVPFIPPLTSGRVVKVYDGDTLTIASKLPAFSDELYRFSIRLCNIDTPEIRADDDNERDAARESRDALAGLCLGNDVNVDVIKVDKYGRLLANVFIRGVNVSSWMLAQRFAVPYDGGKKKSPLNWKKYRETGDMEYE